MESACSILTEARRLFERLISMENWFATGFDARPEGTKVQGPASTSAKRAPHIAT